MDVPDAPLVARPGPLWSMSMPASARYSVAQARGRGLPRLGAAAAGGLGEGSLEGSCGPATHPGGARVFTWGNSSLLALVCCYSFFAAALISIASPFLPQGLLAVGASETLVGLIFASYPAMNLVLSPFCTPACAKLGRRRVFVLGIVLEAVAAVAMGLVPIAPGAGLVYLLLRVAQGTGAALSYTALLASCADRFRGGLATLVGLQEAVAGVGYMVGPPIGGGLYAAGGFRLPFIVMGLGLVVCLPLLPFALPASAEGDEDQAVAGPAAAGELTAESSSSPLPGFVQHPELSFMAVARLPAVMNASLVTLLAGLAFGFIGPTLAPHLRDTLHASERAIGGLFGLAAGAYALASPGAGALADAYGPKRILAIGIAGLSISYIFLGPSPLLGAHASGEVATPGAWALQCISLTLLGLAAALAFIPCMPAMEVAVLARFGDSPASGETVAALYNGIYCAGEALGPLAGAAMTGLMGFKWASTLVAAILMSYCLALAGVEVHKRGALPGAGAAASAWRAATAAAARRTASGAGGWRRVFSPRRGGGDADGEASLLWEPLIDEAVGEEDEL